MLLVKWKLSEYKGEYKNSEIKPQKKDERKNEDVIVCCNPRIEIFFSFNA